MFSREFGQLTEPIIFEIGLVTEPVLGVGAVQEHKAGAVGVSALTRIDFPDSTYVLRCR